MSTALAGDDGNLVFPSCQFYVRLSKKQIDKASSLKTAVSDSDMFPNIISKS